MAHVFEHPRGMLEGLGEDRQLQAHGRTPPRGAADVGEAVADVALALGADRHVDGQHQRVEAGVGGAPDQVVGDLAVARGVELIPGVLGRDLGRVLDGVGAGARHDVGDVGVGRGAGQHQIGAAPEQPGAAGRRDAERALVGAPENRRRLVARGHVDQVARQELVLAKRRGVALEAVLVLEAALDEIERDLGQPALGHLVQVFDIDRFFDTHRRCHPRFVAIRQPSIAGRAGQEKGQDAFPDRWLGG